MNDENGFPADAAEAPASENEVTELRRKADEYLDLARRAKADLINYENRVGREKAQWREDAVGDFLKDFLPAIDTFTWARFEEPALMKSLRLVESEFLRTLAKHRIVPIETDGKMFDPVFHEAVAVEETDDRPPGAILEQVRRGWMIGDRVLRPASVRVARAPIERKGNRRESAKRRDPNGRS